MDLESVLKRAEDGYKLSDEEIEFLKKEKFLLEKEYNIHENLEQAYKLFINASYGVIGNDKFYFYNVNCAKSITIQGQKIAKIFKETLELYFTKKMEQDKHIKHLFKDGVVKNVSPPILIYGDTDSFYINFEEVVKQKREDLSEIEFIQEFYKIRLKQIFSFILENIRKQYNLTFNEFEIKFESIVKTFVIFGLKNYCQDIIWKKPGIVYESMTKLDFKGIDAIKSSTPKLSRIKLKEFLYLLLKRGKNLTIDEVKDFINKSKTEFKKASLYDISIVTKLSKYDEYVENDVNFLSYKKGCPIHIKASSFYNFYIHKNKLNSKYRKLMNGDKVLYFFFDKNKSKFSFDIPPDCDVFGFPPDNYPKNSIPLIDFERHFNRIFVSIIERYLKKLKMIGENETLNDYINSTSLF